MIQHSNNLHWRDLATYVGEVHDIRKENGDCLKSLSWGKYRL
jgi:hypothetical protein